jgi:hypothetical protein
MAETLYPEYENLGLVSGYKTFVDIQDKLKQIQIDLKNGYTDLTEEEAKKRNLPYPYRIQLPQFSEAYTQLFEEQKQLESRTNYLVPVLKKLAKEYTPLPGPELPIMKEEKRIIQNIAGISPVIKTQPAAKTGGQTLTAAQSKAAATGRTLVEPTGVAPVLTETTITSTTPTNGATIPTDTVGKRKAYVDAQLATQKLEDTPANRKKLREEFNATQPAGKTAVVDTAWEATFKEKFPSKAWLLTEIDRAKYPQLFSTIQNAITTKMYDSNTGLALFEEQLKGTDFFKEISTSGKVQEIKKLVGNLGFDTTDFVQFVNTSINYGWTGDKLKQETYKNAFETDPVTKKYLNPNAVDRVRASADYISTQNIAKQFFNMNPSETDVLKVLTGEQTAADYEMQQREFVKNIESYKHLAPLLDLGLTMTGIADRYRKTAANLLEVDENSIDMSTANYEQALTYNDNGKMRLMTNGEWEKLLRTDPRYKWEYTNNAKSEARSLSSNIAQALGKVV